VRGVKTSCGDLNNASELRVGQGSGQLNIRTSGRANVTFSICPCPYQAASDNIGAIVPASCGLLIRGLRGIQGGAIDKATIAQRYGKALPCESPVSHQGGLESLAYAG